ncbi:MAG: hydantoinase/oxoprolinase family protein [Acidimicrobiia bacterium]
MAAVLGVDVGGTFTDLVRWDGAEVTTWKEPSTPEDQSVGVVAGAGRMGRTDQLLHGTTVATNALLERRGAKTALVTSAGFEDVIEIGRQDRPSLYDSFADRPQPLVDRERRFGVPDDVTGWVPPTELAEVEAVAVSLLYGHLRPDDEVALAAALEQALPGVPVSRSSGVVAEFREYERTATTVLNAYLAPETGSYLARLAARSLAAGLPGDVLVMRSSGGLLPIGEAAELPAAMVLSGPAGGVVAASALAGVLGHRRVISFDMGGTSTDVCRIEDGRPELTYERAPGGHACRMPSVAIHTVGAGGGSIGWRDDGGSLRVGPRSSGAVPGPACYGKGGVDPTVTDAHVVTGRIDPDGTLAGSLRMHPGAARVAIGALGETLGLDLAEAGLGIITVVEAVMAAAVRRVSVEEGADPRGAHLIAFGGAGGLHATALARGLGMDGVVVPSHAGVFSALGLLLSPLRIDLARSRLRTVGDAAELSADVAAVRADAVDRFARAGAGTPASVDLRIDVRYLGQSHELAIPWVEGGDWDDLAAAFHDSHRRRNGFARPDDPIEVVTVRAEVIGEPALDLGELPAPMPSGDALVGTRQVLTGTGPVEASVVRRVGLAPGEEVIGPAVVEESEATTWIGPGERAVVHESGALAVAW